MMKWEISPARLRAVGILSLGVLALLTGSTVLFGWVDWIAVGRRVRPNAVPFVLFAAALACAATGAWLLLRGGRAPRTRVPGMNWWIVATGAVVVVTVSWAATGWLFREASTAKDVGAARVEAVKTGLGIGAGATGIFALLLAARRQWHVEVDATEKNVTELYTKAADQLGNDKAPVRLAGLYALERLAHGNPSQRQSIVNVICAYLRMPFEFPDTSAEELPTEELQELKQEQEVRLAAQRILTDHLRPDQPESFWCNIDLDLTNAHLIHFYFKGRRARMATFIGARFSGSASFDKSTFTNDAHFRGVEFAGGANFYGSHFGAIAGFSCAKFSSLAAFAGATFKGVAMFAHSTFTEPAWFEGATFIDGALFERVKFSGGTLFNDAKFLGGARFDSATSRGEPYEPSQEYRKLSGVLFELEAHDAIVEEHRGRSVRD